MNHSGSRTASFTLATSSLIAFLLVVSYQELCLHDAAIYRQAVQALWETGSAYNSEFHKLYLVGLCPEVIYQDNAPLQVLSAPNSLVLYTPFLLFAGDSWKVSYYVALVLFFVFSLRLSFKSIYYESILQIFKAALVFLVILWLVCEVLLWGGVAFCAGIFFCLAELFRRRRYYFFAGILMALTVVKPNLSIIILVWAFSLGLYEKNIRLLLGLLIGLLGPMVLSYQLAGSHWWDFIAEQQGIGWQLVRFSQTLGSLAFRFDMSERVLLFLPVLLVGVVLFIAMGFERNRAKLRAEYILLFSCIFAPYGWLHDFILAVPFLLSHLNHRFLSLRFSWISVIFCMIIFVSIVIATRGSSFSSVFIFNAVLLGLAAIDMCEE